MLLINKWFKWFIMLVFSNPSAKVVHIQETTVPRWENSVSKREK